MEESLKRRLTGAVILVFIAVIFIPAILDGPDDAPTTTEVGLRLPAPGESGTAVEQHRFTLPEAGDPDQGAVATGADAGEQTVGRGAQAATSTTVSAGSIAVAIEAWAVQVGSFASRDNADRLVSRLLDNGFSAFIVQIEDGGRLLFRVRVGPERDRRRAEVLAERLASEVEATPKVVQHP